MSIVIGNSRSTFFMICKVTFDLLTPETWQVHLEAKVGEFGLSLFLITLIISFSVVHTIHHQPTLLVCSHLGVGVGGEGLERVVI